MTPTSTGLQRIERALDRPVSAASRSAFRAMFGTLLAIEAVRYFTNGWIEAHLLGPAYHFPWAGFEWVAPLPGLGMHIVLAGLAVAGGWLASGWGQRGAAAVLAVGWTYLLLIDKALYLNHHYLAILLCWAHVAMPPVDRRGRTPGWTLDLLRALWLIVYFWAGVTKVEPDFLSGIPLHLATAGVAAVPGIGEWLASRPVAIAASWGITGLELAAPVLLLWRPTRWATMAGFVLFHLATMVFYDIGIFPWLSLAMLTLWLDPEWCAPAQRIEAPVGPTPRPLWMAVVAVVLFQAVFPARWLAVSGDPSWTMQGARGSWRLLAAVKTGWVRFELHEPVSGQTTELSPLELLTPWQASKMARDPWMIREFAEFLAAEQERQGRPRIEVRARTGISLNGRPPVPSINPAVDLARVRDDAPVYSWILPMTEPLADPPVALDGDWWLDHMLGYAHFERVVDEAVAHGELEQGADAMDRMLALEPERVDGPRRWVEGLRESGRLDDALVQVGRWIAADPESAEAHLQRGLIHHRAGRWLQAELAYDQAIRLGADERAEAALADVRAIRGR